MNRITSVAASLLAIVAMAALLAACGGDDEGLLPGDDAEEMIANLERVEQLATDGECDAAETAIDEVAAQVEGLPEFVSDRLQSNLMAGIARLREVVAENCPDHDIDDADDTAPEEPADDEDPDERADEDREADDARDRPDRDRDDAGPPDRDRDPSGGGAGRDRPTPPEGSEPGGRGDGRTPPPSSPEPDDTGGIVPDIPGSHTGDAQ